MANIRVIQSPYIGPFSNVETVNEIPPSTTNTGIGIHQGELGGRVELTQTGSGTKEYQKCQIDSGATATANLAPAIGQMLYWKNKASYIVTNDSRFAVGGQTTSGWRNEVAGILLVAATPGNNVWLQQKGNCTTVNISSGSPNPGDLLIASTSTTLAQGTIVTAGSAAPVVQNLGKFALAQTTVTVATVDLDIPGIP